MRDIDFNEQFIIYAIYNGNGKWYISDKEVWYLDYEKRIEAYKKIGYDIKKEYIDERRRDLLCTEDNTLLFLKRMEPDEISTLDLKEIFYESNENISYIPSLYVDFDKKIFYSMYTEPASYEDYVPTGWRALYENFLERIPSEKRYWEK